MIFLILGLLLSLCILRYVSMEECLRRVDLFMTYKIKINLFFEEYRSPHSLSLIFSLGNSIRDSISYKMTHNKRGWECYKSTRGKRVHLAQGQYHISEGF